MMEHRPHRDLVVERAPRRAASCAASSECPPSEKKSASRSTCGRASSSRNKAATRASSGSSNMSLPDAGAAALVRTIASWGAGRALRSILPLVVSGSVGSARRRWARCRRKSLRDVRAERFFFDVGTRMRHDIGEQPGLAARRRAADHHGARDGGMRQQHMLHFAGFDAVTTDLELEVVPAQAFERAVVAPAAEVAGPVKAAKRAAVDEAPGGQFGAAKVAARDALTADAQLTDDTDRHLGAARIQHVELRVLQRLTDGNGRIDAIDAVATGHTVVSVGPYTFHNAPREATSAAARSAGSASPPHQARRAMSPCQPASSGIRHAAGVACITSTRCVDRMRADDRDRRRPRDRPARRWRRSPTEAAARHTAMSNESVVSANTTSPSPMPGDVRKVSIRLATLRCLTCTPLGRPVEPEV